MRERLFTAAELDYVAPKADPVPSLAARFAAREAVMKAMGLGLGAFGSTRCRWNGRRVGAPSLIVVGRAAELAGERGVTRWHLSASATPTCCRGGVRGRRVNRRHTLQVVILRSSRPDEMRAIDARRPRTGRGTRRSGRRGRRPVAAVRMLGGTYGRVVNVIAGTGNNGADGRVAGRPTRRRGVQGPRVRRRDVPAGAAAAPTS